MTAKKVSMKLKPGVQKHAEAWVGEGHAPATPRGPQKRLTIDIPVELHRKLKVKAASDGVRMADLVRSWIEEGCTP